MNRTLLVSLAANGASAAGLVATGVTTTRSSDRLKAVDAAHERGQPGRVFQAVGLVEETPGTRLVRT